MCLFQLLEEEEIEVPVSIVKEPTKEETRMDTDEVPNDGVPASSTSAGDNDANMQDDIGTAVPAAGVENGVPESADKPVQMETDTKVCLSNHYIMSCWLN